jgi:hypothetical protein
LVSLRKYPLPLNSGKECLILEGFGDKICKLIDERLKTFLQEGGVLHDSESNIEMIDDDDDNQHISKKVGTKIISDSYEDQYQEDITSRDYISNTKKASSSRPLLNLNPKKKATSTKKCDTNEDESDESNAATSQVAKNKTKTSRGKEYIPSFRSGPYAILVTLYENQKIDVNIRRFEKISINYLIF